MTTPTSPTTSEPTYVGPVYNGPIYSDKPKNDAEVLGVDHQRAGQVRQLLAERANCVAYGQPDRVKSIDVSLDMMGYTGDRTIGPSGLPVGRSAKPDNAVTTAADAPKTPDVPKTAPPASPAASAPAGASTSATTKTTAADPADPSKR
jgi:hypothetical protein